MYVGERFNHIDTLSVNNLVKYTASLPVGISETQQPVRCSVYPNPVMEKLTIQFQKPMEGVLIEVFDLVGKKIIEEKQHKDARISQVDVSILSPGVYCLKVSTGRDVVMKKFLKQ